MKTWLTRNRRQLFALGIVAVMGVVFSLGWYAGSNATNQKAYAALWKAMIDLPDPEQCALCSKGMQYHAPCLIDLSTGQMGEMKVYTGHPSHQGELAPKEKQQTGTFNFQLCAGLPGIRNTCNHTCTVTLPEERELMDPALFCQECRQLLAGAGLDGYVIVDLHDLDHVRAYPVRDEVIRDYRISVDDRKDGKLDVCVKGLLDF